jgi:hypothetical protein
LTHSQVKVEVAVRFCKRYSLKIPFIVWYLHSCGTNEDLLGNVVAMQKEGGRLQNQREYKRLRLKGAVYFLKNTSKSCP